MGRMKKGEQLIKNLLQIIFMIIVLVDSAWGQNTGELVSQVSEIYTGHTPSAGNLIGGFSLWGLIGGFLFSGIGLIAFSYGKKNGAFKAMIIGILLMVYPYLLRGTLALYLVGIGLTATLFILRD